MNNYAIMMMLIILNYLTLIVFRYTIYNTDLVDRYPFVLTIYKIYWCWVNISSFVIAMITVIKLCG